jgi:hypothetical protein
VLPTQDGQHGCFTLGQLAAGSAPLLTASDKFDLLYYGKVVGNANCANESRSVTSLPKCAHCHSSGQQHESSAEFGPNGTIHRHRSEIWWPSKAGPFEAIPAHLGPTLRIDGAQSNSFSHVVGLTTAAFSKSVTGKGGTTARARAVLLMDCSRVMPTPYPMHAKVEAVVCFVVTRPKQPPLHTPQRSDTIWVSVFVPDPSRAVQHLAGKRITVGTFEYHAIVDAEQLGAAKAAKLPVGPVLPWPPLEHYAKNKTLRIRDGPGTKAAQFGKDTSSGRGELGQACSGPNCRLLADYTCIACNLSACVRHSGGRVVDASECVRHTAKYCNHSPKPNALLHDFTNGGNAKAGLDLRIAVQEGLPPGSQVSIAYGPTFSGGALKNSSLPLPVALINPPPHGAGTVRVQHHDGTAYTLVLS